MNLATALLFALGLSLLGNGVLGWAYLGARDQRVEAIGARDQARGAATACNDGVEALLAVAASNADVGAQARAAAEKSRRDREARAQRILSAPASVPGDDCKSAGDAIDAWLKDANR